VPPDSSRISPRILGNSNGNGGASGGGLVRPLSHRAGSVGMRAGTGADGSDAMSAAEECAESARGRRLSGTRQIGRGVSRAACFQPWARHGGAPTKSQSSQDRPGHARQHTLMANG